MIDETEREALRALDRARTTEQRLAMRARVVLAAADGVADERIAEDLGVHKMTVLLWRGRFTRDRLAGLADAPRPGRVPTNGRAERDRVIALTLERPPGGTTHWRARRMAARTGISITTIQRSWAVVSTKSTHTSRRRADILRLQLTPMDSAWDIGGYTQRSRIGTALHRRTMHEGSR